MRLTLGWTPDLPDPRDRKVEVLQGGGDGSDDPAVWEIQEEDRDEGDSETTDGVTSSAIAVICLVDWVSRRLRGERLDGSPEFLSQLTKPVCGCVGATTLRDTIKTLRRYGAPPRGRGDTTHRLQGQTPDPRDFAFARDYAGLRYRRIDDTAASPEVVLQRLRQRLRQGAPCVFGFTAFDSIGSGPWVPFTPDRSIVLGGAAVIATGYDDTTRGPNGRGALRVRSCWGADWGDGGYGWLPYDFVTQGLARDFWELSFDADL